MLSVEALLVPELREAQRLPASIDLLDLLEDTEIRRGAEIFAAPDVAVAWTFPPRRPTSLSMSSVAPSANFT